MTGPQRLERLGGRGDGGGADVAVADRGHDVPRSISLSSTIRRFLTCRSRKVLMPAKASSSDCLAHRLLQEGEGPQLHPALPAVVNGDDVDGDVAGARVVLQAVEDHPAVHVGQPQVKCDGGGLQLDAPAPRRLRRTK